MVESSMSVLFRIELLKTWETGPDKISIDVVMLNFISNTKVGSNILKLHNSKYKHMCIVAHCVLIFKLFFENNQCCSND